VYYNEEMHVAHLQVTQSIKSVHDFNKYIRK